MFEIPGLPRVLLCRLSRVRSPRDHFVEAYTAPSTRVGSRDCCSISRIHYSCIVLSSHSGKLVELFGYIVYTEQRENHHGTMILDGVCHSALHFGRVMLSRMVEPSRSQSSKAFFWPFLVIYGRSLCFPFNAPLLIQYVLQIISLETLDLPSSEVASTH